VWKLRKFTPTLKNFREINLQYNSLQKKYFDGIYAKKSWGKVFEITTLCSKNLKFPHCATLTLLNLQLSRAKNAIKGQCYFFGLWPICGIDNGR